MPPYGTSSFLPWLAVRSSSAAYGHRLTSHSLCYDSILILWRHGLQWYVYSMPYHLPQTSYVLFIQLSYYHSRKSTSSKRLYRRSPFHPTHTRKHQTKQIRVRTLNLCHYTPRRNISKVFTSTKTKYILQKDVSTGHHEHSLLGCTLPFSLTAVSQPEACRTTS